MSFSLYFSLSLYLLVYSFIGLFACLSVGLYVSVNQIKKEHILIHSVWDAIGLSTRSPKVTSKEDKANASMGGRKINRETVKDLNDLVSRIGFQPPSGAPSGDFQPDGSISNADKLSGNERKNKDETFLNEELRGVKMIPVANDDFSLLSKESVDRNHLQRRESLLAARTLPLLKDLLFVKDAEPEAVEGDSKVDMEKEKENENGNENENSVDNVSMNLEDKIDYENNFDVEDEDYVEVDETENLSAPFLMIRSNIGASYHELNENIKKLNTDNIKKVKRIKELEDQLK